MAFSSEQLARIVHGRSLAADCSTVGAAPLVLPRLRSLPLDKLEHLRSEALDRDVVSPLIPQLVEYRDVHLEPSEPAAIIVLARELNCRRPELSGVHAQEDAALEFQPRLLDSIRTRGISDMAQLLKRII